MKTLISLEEHQRNKLYANKDTTGIACPNCGDELKLTNPGIIMLSSPPQADVKCFKCDYATRIYI